MESARKCVLARAATMMGRQETNRLRLDVFRCKVWFIVPSRTRWIALKGLGFLGNVL